MGRPRNSMIAVPQVQQLLCAEMAAARRVAAAHGHRLGKVADVARAYGCAASFIYAVERAAKSPPADLVLFYERTFDTDGRLLALQEQLPTRRELLREAARSREGPSRYPLAGDAAEFLGEHPPGGHIVAPSTSFQKRWTIRNAGAVVWEGRRLTRIGPCTGVALLRSARHIPLPRVAPGEQITVTAELRTPPIETSTVAFFKMTDSEGYLTWPDRYSRGLDVEITVRRKWPARYVEPEERV